jgi:23S rRNA pseudouridine2604 synthase
MEFPIRINKYLAERGDCSRREADTLIAAGKVKINGVRAELGTQVTATDTVEIVGQTPHKRYLAYYKGRGIITHSPSPNETDVALRLKKDFGLTGVSPIGRLDKDSEGLLLLSDDGRLTGPLLDPEAGHEKEYEVTVDKSIGGMFVKQMSGGVSIEGYRTKPATVVAHPKDKTRFNITLTEGKKHQIRRMCAALGYQVQSLKRVRIMHIVLGTLKPNQFRKLTKEELTTLLAQLHIKS